MNAWQAEAAAGVALQAPICLVSAGGDLLHQPVQSATAEEGQCEAEFAVIFQSATGTAAAPGASADSETVRFTLAAANSDSSFCTTLFLAFSDSCHLCL